MPAAAGNHPGHQPGTTQARHVTGQGLPCAHKGPNFVSVTMTPGMASPSTTRHDDTPLSSCGNAMLDGDKCWWLAADFDGPEAMLDALMYVKAAALGKSPSPWRSPGPGVGGHAWVFFISPVPADVARRLGTGLLRETMALRGRMTLASYDRLFPSQDLLPVAGSGT